MFKNLQKYTIWFFIFLFCFSFLSAEESKAISHGSVVIGGEKIAYTATVGSSPLMDENKQQTGTIYWISYVKEGDSAKRPICFCFNGGPGSSSVWLHLGALGPRKVQFNEEGDRVLSMQTEENPFSILNVADLVFIDPISTGYSRATEGEEKKFHGVESDIKSVAECIRHYLTEHKRWTSPKFLIGESYGTTRAAGLCCHLKERYFMNIEGVVLISMALNFQTFSFEFGNDLPYITFLPTYTANAWHHQKLNTELMGDLHQALSQSSVFAMHEYAQALMQGDALDDQEREQIAQRLAQLTGLSETIVKEANLRITPKLFRQQLLQEKVLGRFDGRITGFQLGNESADYDPSMELACPVFTAALNQYMADALKWEDKENEEYKVLTNVFPWDFCKTKTGYLNVAENLREALIFNPKMRVLVMSGYYDLALPFMGAEYTVDHLYLPKELRRNVEMEYYPSGHMMYLHRPSLKKMQRDLVNFINR